MDINDIINKKRNINEINSCNNDLHIKTDNKKFKMNENNIKRSFANAFNNINELEKAIIIYKIETNNEQNKVVDVTIDFNIFENYINNCQNKSKKYKPNND